MILGGILRPMMLAAPAGDDLGGQVIEKANLSYRATKSAPFYSILQYVTQLGTIDDS